MHAAFLLPLEMAWKYFRKIDQAQYIPCVLTPGSSFLLLTLLLLFRSKA